MTAGEPTGIEGAETARRAVRLLEIVATAGEPVSRERIGEQAGLSKSTAYRLLRALQDEGWLERAGRAGYQVGGRLIQLAAAVGPGRDIAVHARPWLESLASLTSETVTIAVRDGNWAVVMAGAQSNAYALHRSVQIGHRTPLARGCTGLAILAWLPAPEKEQIARELVAASLARPAEVTDLLSRLSTIARDGFVRSSEENHPGVSAVGAPVFVGTGGPVAGSIVIGGPIERFTTDLIDQAVPALLSATAELSASLTKTTTATASGYPPASAPPGPREVHGSGTVGPTVTVVPPLD